MNKNVKKITKDQLVEVVTKITKQVIKESLSSGQEIDDGGLETIQDNPEMEVSTDDEFYDDFLSNPAEESFPDEEPTEGDEDDEIDIDDLLENKEKEELSEKQNKLINFITENWNNHANSLIM